MPDPKDSTMTKPSINEIAAFTGKKANRTIWKEDTSLGSQLCVEALLLDGAGKTRLAWARVMEQKAICLPHS